VFRECSFITVDCTALNGKDGAFSYFHGHTSCVWHLTSFWVLSFHGMFKENGPSIPLGEFPLGHSASLGRIAIPSEKNNQHTFKNTQLQKKKKKPSFCELCLYYMQEKRVREKSEQQVYRVSLPSQPLTGVFARQPTVLLSN